MALFRQIPLGVQFGDESKSKPTKTTHSAPAILLNDHFPKQEQAHRCLTMPRETNSNDFGGFWN